jgi:hypothetical protein
MKKVFSLFIALIMMGSVLTTTAFAAPTITTTPTPELGQLKICKVAGSGVTLGNLFTIKVGATSYSVPAGYCVLAGQFSVNTQVTIQETIPSGYFVSNVEVKPSTRMISKDTAQGKVVVKIGTGVTEVLLTNATSSETPTPTKTPSGPTPTSSPKGRLQICKEADGEGVSGYFTFRFETRSRSIPVGACSLIISVDAGTLRVTEDARAGFVVSDIYTIPAGRLISKNLSRGSATVTIVEGTTSSQTIVVFRNRAVNSPATPTPTTSGTPPTPTFTSSPTPTVTGTPPTFTPTSTPTSTPTGTITPPACQPTTVTANFTQFAPGASVEGMGVVAPGLNIDAKGTAVRVAQGTDPQIYVAPNNASGAVNGAMVADGGFSDVTTKNAFQPHLYNFTFAPGVSVTNFSVHMLDYGDWNPTLSTSHYASMTAYDVNGNVVSKQELSYTTLAEESPRSSNLYGDLWLKNGDATTAAIGQPGNWIWNVSGNGIVRVVLEFGVGYDPNIAFDLLFFTVKCQ